MKFNLIGAEEVRQRWAKLAPAAANATRKNFWGYIKFLVDYIKRNKLSGQVLGKYRGAYNLLGGRASFSRGNPRWEHQPGALKKTFQARQAGDLRAVFVETNYGAAWERGFSRRAYTVSAKHLTRNGLLGYLTWFGRGKWNFAKEVHIPAQTFPAKPHIVPAIKETQHQLRNMVIRPMLNALASGTSSTSQVAYPFGAFGRDK